MHFSHSQFSSAVICVAACFLLASCGLVGDDGNDNNDDVQEDPIDTPAWVGDWEVTDRPADSDFDYWVIDEVEIVKAIDLRDSNDPEDCQRVDRTIANIDEINDTEAVVTFDVEGLGSVDVELVVSNETLNATVLDSHDEDEVGDEYTFSATDDLPFALDTCVPIG